LWAESTESFAPILAPLIVKGWTQRDNETSLPELCRKPFHGYRSAIIGIESQHHTFDLWGKLCQPR
jgi:hypothetical protein